MSDQDRQTLLQKLSWITYNDGVAGESERHSYDQNNNTLSETRKRFEHLLLSQAGRLLKQDEPSVLTKWMQVLSTK